MSAIVHDAVGLLSPDARAAYDRGDLADIVYADDTLLAGASSKFLHEFLRAVAAAGLALWRVRLFGQRRSWRPAAAPGQRCCPGSGLA